jgi:hypothetical protein
LDNRAPSESAANHAYAVRRAPISAESEEQGSQDAACSNAWIRSQTTPEVHL